MPKIKTSLKVYLIIIAAALLALSIMPNSLLAQSIDQLQQQINNLSDEISSSEDRIKDLRKKKDSLKNRLAILEAEARRLQLEINVTEREISDTRAEIALKEAELQRTKELIQENVRVLYKYGNPSTIEILFSSQNFTDFVNRQEYLDRVKLSLNDAARESVRIKEELEEKEEELSLKITELDSQKLQLAARQEEQRRLIAETQGEENRYQAIVAKKRKSLEEAKAQLAQAIAFRQRNVSRGGTGNYPWSDAGGSKWDFNDCWGFDDSSWSSYSEYGPNYPWGMCLRHCTSYGAWKVHMDYTAGKVSHDMPNWGGRGDAYQWIDNAKSAGIPTGSKPKVGAIAVNPNVACDGSGFCYGHLMYVEKVISRDWIEVSQYNAQALGEYTTASEPTDGLTFIYFREW